MSAESICSPPDAQKNLAGHVLCRTVIVEQATGETVDADLMACKEQAHCLRIASGDALDQCFVGCFLRPRHSPGQADGRFRSGATVVHRGSPSTALVS